MGWIAYQGEAMKKKIVKILAGGFLLGASAGCASGGSAFSFAVPELKKEQLNEPKSLPEALERVRDRYWQYQDAGRSVANAPQFFDLSSILLGLTGVGGVAFGAHSDLAKGAALGGTGLFLTRNYYKFDSRRVVSFQRAATTL